MNIQNQDLILINEKAHIKGQIIENSLRYHEKISLDLTIKPKSYLNITKKILKLIDETDYHIIKIISEKINER